MKEDLESQAMGARSLRIFVDHDCLFTRLTEKSNRLGHEKLVIRRQGTHEVASSLGLSTPRRLGAAMSMDTREEDPSLLG